VKGAHHELIVGATGLLGGETCRVLASVEEYLQALTQAT
jgi:uncharacterized protein YbjT (DUF2867 family)